MSSWYEQHKNDATLHYVGGNGRGTALLWEVTDNPKNLNAEQLTRLAERGLGGFGAKLEHRNGHTILSYYTD